MKRVAFVCVHNSCRSQIAEALCKKYLSDVCECWSAGTEIKPRINKDAVRLMKQLHGIDMEKEQYPKLLADIPAVDIVITMGCCVQCPYIPGAERCDWGLDDPTGQGDEKFIEVIQQIEERLRALGEHLRKSGTEEENALK